MNAATTTLAWRTIFNLGGTITEGVERYVRLIARGEGASLDEDQVEKLCIECRMAFTDAVHRAFPAASVSLGGNVIDVPADGGALRALRGFADDAFVSTYIATRSLILGGAA